MSELINVSNRNSNFRSKLLISASSLALLAIVADPGSAAGADQDPSRPTVWIELGAQSERVGGSADPYVLPFEPGIVADGFQSPTALQHALSQSFGGEGRISFRPENSDWVVSMSALYGRANGSKKTHEQTPGGNRPIHLGTHYGSLPARQNTQEFSDSKISNSETHLILDFQAGKDIGLGLFGKSAISTVEFGVRFAQFTSKQTLGVTADPVFHFPSTPFRTKYHRTYLAASHMERSFRGLGPSLSWNASLPVIGDRDDGGLSLDWGVNAALLFGRQKAQGHHQTIGLYYKTNELLGYFHNTQSHRSGNPDRSRSVTVPNLGGFAGASFLFSNARVSLGYRADFFFGAMDGGINSVRKEDRDFYGPFANISVGFP